MKTMTYHIALMFALLLGTAACTVQETLPEPEAYSIAQVRFGKVGGETTNAIHNESYCGDVHVLNYSSGLRRKYAFRSNYMENALPIGIEVAVGRSSTVYVVGNVNRYFGRPVTEADFPVREADLAAWLVRLTRTQIEAHKTNTTDPLFLIWGKSEPGDIVATDSPDPIDMPIELSRVLSKVDMKLWYDPSVTQGRLDMTGARVFFSQYVPRVRPFALDGGEVYLVDRDNPDEPYLYSGLLTLTEGTPTEYHSGFFGYERNFLPSNNATSKLEATYCILEAKWEGKTAYWKGLIATDAFGAPYRLESNVHLTVEAQIKGAGSDTPDITEDITLDVVLHLAEWEVNDLGAVEAGN